MLSLKGAERFFAQAMAQSTDDEQAAFFNEFGRLLPLICTTGIGGAETQLAYLVRNLDSSGRSVIMTLAKLIEVDDDEL